MSWPRRIVVWFTVCMCVLPASVSAAQSADTVRGVVYDSLLKVPLDGATILGSVRGQSEAVTATSDGEGRYVLTAAGPIERIAVFHDDFERIGLSALEAVRPTGLASWRPQVATPSLATLWLRLCERPIPAAGRTGILYGTVRMPDDTTRVSGASVVVGWELGLFAEESEKKKKPVANAPEVTTATTRSNPQGEYVFCGLPDYGQAGIEAKGSDYRTSAVLLIPDGRMVRRIDLVMGDPARSGALNGTLLDESGFPVADATVSIDGVEGIYTSDRAGRFIATNVPTGTRMLSARKIGFVPAVLTADIVADRPQDIRVPMQRGTTLEGVKITARYKLNREAVDFNRRRLVGLGKYMDAKELANIPRIHDALRMFPSLTVQAVGRNGIDFVILGRQRRAALSTSALSITQCRATVYLDGILEQQDMVSLIQLDALASIEVFDNGVVAPAKYRNFEDNCAVVLLWTKAFLIR